MTHPKTTSMVLDEFFAEYNVRGFAFGQEPIGAHHIPAGHITAAQMAQSHVLSRPAGLTAGESAQMAQLYEDYRKNIPKSS